MKVKPLKWKKIKGEYVATTPYGEMFFIEFCDDRFHLDMTFDSIVYKSKTLKEAQDRAFKKWCKYLKNEKMEINRMNKMLQECIEE